jgi:hypothetical protein
MSSLSVLSPAFRPNLARLAVVGIFALVLVGLGFLVPFWIVLVISSVFALLAAAVRALRRAARQVDTILAEELGEAPPNDTFR